MPTRLLVIGLERPDATVHSEELYQVADRLGMSEQQVRLCVRRLIGDGYYEQQGRGRRAVLHGTDKPRALAFPESAWSALAHRQDQGDAPWDDRWHLYLMSVPERVRQVRDQLRAQMAHLGAASLAGGVYVSPHDLHDELTPVLTRLGAQSYVSTATSSDLSIAGEAHPEALARLLWPVAELEVAYAALHQDTILPLLHRLTTSAPVSGPDASTMALTTVVRTAQVMQDDPLLPLQLLPAPWVGTQVRRDLARLVRALRELLDQPPAALFLLGL